MGYEDSDGQKREWTQEDVGGLIARKEELNEERLSEITRIQQETLEKSGEKSMRDIPVSSNITMVNAEGIEERVRVLLHELQETLCQRLRTATKTLEGFSSERSFSEKEQKKLGRVESSLNEIEHRLEEIRDFYYRA